MVTVTTAELAEAIGAIEDPELPVLTIDDLGIVRRVEGGDGHVTVTITPTYSGCPAIEEIKTRILRVLGAHGVSDGDVAVSLSPPWTTEWITEQGRRKLADAGIAPPDPTAGGGSGPVMVELSVRCPHCGSFDTDEISHFSATPCAALYRCNACREPFDRIKPH